jgi:DNA-binding transcriptional ArsR family regulator
MNDKNQARHGAGASRSLPADVSAASSSKLDLIFSALSNPTRREILARLSKGESTVTELAEPFHMSLPGVSKHLHVLEEAHVISMVKEGRTYRCRLDLFSLVQAAQWMDFYRGLWMRQLDYLSEYLQKPGKEGDS